MISSFPSPLTLSSQYTLHGNASNVKQIGAALADGDATRLKSYISEITNNPYDARFLIQEAITSIKDRDGLHIALVRGYADAVKELGKLLELVDESERVELLAAKDDYGNSRLKY
jgi:hypothetical protein